jgi:hypothetical protein
MKYAPGLKKYRIRMKGKIKVTTDPEFILYLTDMLAERWPPIQVIGNLGKAFKLPYQFLSKTRNISNSLVV